MLSGKADGLLFYQHGNGAERVLENHDPGIAFAGVAIQYIIVRMWRGQRKEGVCFHFAGTETVGPDGYADADRTCRLCEYV